MGCVTTNVSTKCICGNELQARHAVNAQSNSIIKFRTLCDICDSIVDQGSIIWHCSSGYNIFHPDGYDICNDCYIKNTEDTEVTEPACNLNEMSDQIKSPTSEDINCENKENCVALKAFVAKMRQYNDSYVETTDNMDQKQLIQVINNYLHLMHQHDDDEQFQILVDLLGYCDTTKCVKFTRNNRNRTISKDDEHQEMKKYNAMMNIMDTMHCYFYHCYDIGNRLSTDDHNSIYTSMDELKQDAYDYNSPDVNTLFLNEKKAKIIKITNERRRKYEEIYSKFNTEIYEKYNQLYVEEDMKENSVINISDDRMYQFGILFMYDKVEPRGEVNWPIEGKHVLRKYATLKEELMNNPFATLNIDQYNLEYSKADIFFNSEYCRKHPYFGREADTFIKLKVGHLLSMMVYCNYTKLQYEFSKTYRENNGDNHTNFYCWGKSLKICINYFGTKVSAMNGQKLYHGINQNLYFSSYLGSSSTEGIKVNCPMSTSSSFEVATHFASNQGLVIELQLKRNESKFNDSYYHDKYLSLAWLSDFGNEKEYLFLQGTPMVTISNIVEVHTGYEYEKIFKAITVIEDVFNGCGDNLKSAILYEEYLKTLIKMILEHQLSDSIAIYKPFRSLSIYAKQIVNAFFEQCKEIKIHYWNIRKYYSFIDELLVYLDFESIKLDQLMILCPNIERITISNITLNSLLLEDIGNYLSNIEDISKEIEVDLANLNIDEDQITIDDVINQYSTKFSEFNAFIYSDCDALCIDKGSKIDFAVNYIVNSLAGFSQRVSNDIETFIKQLISNSLSNTNNNDNDQALFKKECFKLEEIDIRYFETDTQPFIAQLIAHPTIDDWIQMDILMQLFSSMTSFSISNIKLSIALIQDILAISVATSLTQIDIFDPIEDEWSKNDIIEKYQHAFATLNWEVSWFEDIDVVLRFEKCE